MEKTEKKTVEEAKVEEPNWKEEYAKLAKAYNELQKKFGSALNIILKLGEE